MAKLKAGDRVDCRIRSGNIVSAYDEHDAIYTFEIIAKDDEGYYLYVPYQTHLNGGSILDADRCIRMGIDKRYVGEKMTYINEGHVSRVAFQLDGMKCDRCKDFVIMAESNQSNGGFLCFSCRFNPYR